MKKLELYQMEKVEGGTQATFIIMCGILSVALGTLTFGLGLLAGASCWALGNNIHL